MKELKIQISSKTEMIDITSLVQSALGRQKTFKGICVVYTPHTTAAITITENADPDVCRAGENSSFPCTDYRHAKNNSPAHVKSALVGASRTVLI